MQKDQIFPNKLTLLKRKMQEYLQKCKNVQHNKRKSTISGTQLKASRQPDEEKNQLITANPELAHILEFADKEVKLDIITLYYTGPVS